MTERRFRGKGGWAPLTDYIAIREDGGYVVHKFVPDIVGADGKAHRCDAFDLKYCLEQVRVGNWEELTNKDQR